MAALSFYSNCCPDSSSYHEQPHQHFSSDVSPEFFYLTQSQLLHDPTFFTTFDYISADSAFFPNAPLFDEASSFIFSDCYSTTDIYPYFSAPAPSADNFIPISAEVFPSDEFEFHCPKRQKVMVEQNLCCGGGVGGYFPQVLTPPELFAVPWDDNGGGRFIFNDQAPAPLSEEMAGGCLKKLLPTNNLSAQTIAARERRRKITAKTQELGELIPGGNKMNTAEMLHSAFKYVKFLQAQVAILQLMQETEEEEEETSEKMEELQILESAMIQEKLYSEEKCLVPKEFVQNLANFPEIQSQPSIFNSINQMLQMSSS